MKSNPSRKVKALSVASNAKGKLPKIHTPQYEGKLSTTTSNKNPGTVRSISSNLEISNITPAPKLNKQKKQKNSDTNIQQIMIEFVPDKFYINSNTQVNFMAYPVIPNINIPSNFSSINLN